MAIKDTNSISKRTRTSRKDIASPATPRFVLTPAEGKRILDVLANPPAPLSEETKRLIADVKRVKVTLNI
jgi:hypothetical protein